MIVWKKSSPMSDSYTDISLHIIFHIKSGTPAIKEVHLPRVFDYIGGTIRSLSGHVYMVGGRPDHIHILTSLPITISVSDFICKIKANASRWIKGLDGDYSDFAWQSGYAAFSVNKSIRNTVINYISNQKEHHATCSTMEEFKQYLQKHGIVINCQKYIGER